MACYEVITDTINVPEDSGSGRHVFRLAVPSGKVVLAGGWLSTFNSVLMSSYPDGDEWVFVFLGVDVTGGYDVDLYVTCF